MLQSGITGQDDSLDYLGNGSSAYALTNHNDYGSIINIWIKVIIVNHIYCIFSVKLNLAPVAYNWYNFFLLYALPFYHSCDMA